MVIIVPREPMALKRNSQPSLPLTVSTNQQSKRVMNTYPVCNQGNKVEDCQDFKGNPRGSQAIERRANNQQAVPRWYTVALQSTCLAPLRRGMGASRSTKRALKAIAGKQRVTDETLLTFMAEVESLVNSRPLTPLNSDCKDLEALKPNHFLLGRANLNLPLDVVSDGDLCSRKRWKHAQVMTNHFWRRDWLQEYLPSITTIPKWRCESREIVEGDLVLVMSENLPRGRWPLARAMRTVRGGHRGKTCAHA